MQYWIQQTKYYTLEPYPRYLLIHNLNPTDAMRNSLRSTILFKFKTYCGFKLRSVLPKTKIFVANIYDEITKLKRKKKFKIIKNNFQLTISYTIFNFKIFFCLKIRTLIKYWIRLRICLLFTTGSNGKQKAGRHQSQSKSPINSVESTGHAITDVVIHRDSKRE